jgi:hypothetical protein
MLSDLFFFPACLTGLPAWSAMFVPAASALVLLEWIFKNNMLDQSTSI